jgi:translation initiation factor IF-2
LSKKPVSLKVHQLAKELNVSSKDIVTRCQVEEIPDIVNHLSNVSIGLAVTVREWFAGAAASEVKSTATATLDRPESEGASSASMQQGSQQGSQQGAKAVKPTSPAAKSVSDRASDRGSEAASAADDAPPAIAKRATKKVAPPPEPEPAPSRTTRSPAGQAAVAAHIAAHAAAHAAAAAAAAAAAPAPEVSSAESISVDSHAHSSSASASAPRTGSNADQPTSVVAHGSPVDGSTSDASKPAAAPVAAIPAPGPVVSNSAPAITTPLRPAAARMPAGLTSRLAPRINDPRDEPASTAQNRSQSATSASASSASSTAPSSTGSSGSTSPGTPRRVITAPPPPPATMLKSGEAPPVMNVPTRPNAVGPVGPQLGSREKTKLSGPQVIRVEQADNLPTPPPMRRVGPGGTGTGGVGGRTGRPGTGTGTGTGGRPDARGRGGIGASRTGRAGEAARVGFNAQDLRDRKARLDGSSGFMRSHRTPIGRIGGGIGGVGGQRTERKPGDVQQIHVAEPLTIKELSAATGVKAVDIIKKLFLSGTMATINSAIDREVAIDMMMECDIDLIVDEAISAADIIEARFKDREKLDERRRAPIVTILGHVDHGKTSLLDRIRSTNIASGEAGGITQSTRAFTVPVKTGDVDRVVTFIDTPGHEAFTAMRARGAKVTDIVVLVISAVDGVMPQTVESINHAKAAGVPVVVALNKIDRPEANEANIRRVLGQLAEHELNPVEWGGTTEVIRTSATRGDGIQQLLEILDYHADLLEMKADFKGSARGTVLEAAIEEGRGPVARVLVQEGCLKKGDFIVIGRGYGRVRDIVNDRGERITEALPSTPVAISGIDELPDAGDKAYVVGSLRAAEEAAEERRRIDRERELAAPKITLDNIFKHLEKQGKKELALVVKGDVQGSVEALKGMLAKLPSEEVAISVKSASAGGINEGDVTLAAATNAIIVGFNVTSSSKARQVAESKGVEIRLYEVIYDLIDDVLKAAQGMLAPELKLEVLGHAEVRQVFRISKVGAIAGCYATDGVLERNAQIRVTRNGIVIEKDRRLEQLKRFKDDAKEVRAGQECGMKIVGYDDIKVGDVLECYKTVEVRRGG